MERQPSPGVCGSGPEPPTTCPRMLTRRATPRETPRNELPCLVPGRFLFRRLPCWTAMQACRTGRIGAPCQKCRLGCSSRQGCQHPTGFFWRETHGHLPVISCIIAGQRPVRNTELGILALMFAHTQLGTAGNGADGRAAPALIAGLLNDPAVTLPADAWVWRVLRSAFRNKR